MRARTVLPGTDRTSTGQDGPGWGTIGAALTEAVQRLAGSGCDTPRLDAELLLAHVLGADRAALLADRGRVLDPAARASFDALVDRRANREPVAYILARKGFRHIEPSVDRRVLVPRPETELLVEAALALPTGSRVVDVGTGSGAVALALKHERADLRITGVDISSDAVAVASENAARLGLEVDFLVADLLEALPGPLDAVVANLPYVADADLDALEPEIAEHEPRGALAGGPDGLDPIRRLVGQAEAVRWIALEVGLGQADETGALLDAAGFESVSALRDLAGIERVVVGSRS